jgi:hypothetical protein
MGGSITVYVPYPPLSTEGTVYSVVKHIIRHKTGDREEGASARRSQTLHFNLDWDFVLVVPFRQMDLYRPSPCLTTRIDR